MFKNFFLVCLLAASMLGLASADTQPAHAARLEISQAWIRWLPGKLPMAGYFTLRNDGADPVTLIGASSSAFNKVMMHESIGSSGSEGMRPVARIEIGSGRQIKFAPGGYHLMLMQRTHPIQVGDTIVIELHLANGYSEAVNFTVRGAAG